MVECNICKRQFNQITSSHLKKVHEITFDKYTEMFPNALLIDPIINKLKGEKVSKTKQQQIITPWNKGIASSEEQKKKQSNTMKQKFAAGSIIHWNKNKQWSPEVKQKIANSLYGHSYFTENSLTKRNNTIQEKVKNGWTSPLKNIPLSSERREKLYLASLHSAEKLKAKKLDNIKFLCEENEIILNSWDDKAYWLNLSCKKCNTSFINTDQVFIKSKNNGKKLCPNCYPNVHSVSKAEIELREFIREIYSGEIIYNDRIELGGFELDILIKEKNLAIEYNGLYWHAEGVHYSKFNIYDKWSLSHKKGIRLISIMEDEWINKPEIVKARLRHILGIPAIKIHARKCSIEKISNDIKNNFLISTHLQGTDVSTIRYGAFYNGELLAVATFKPTSFTKGGDGSSFELNRFSLKEGHSINGILGRLLKKFKDEYHPDKIITYSDKRWNTGNLYKLNGFSYDGKTSLNYWYIAKNTIQRFHRSNYMKHMLKSKLTNYDPTITEWENMKINGFDRIWDCGMSRWIWKNN